MAPFLAFSSTGDGISPRDLVQGSPYTEVVLPSGTLRSPGWLRAHQTLLLIISMVQCKKAQQSWVQIPVQPFSGILTIGKSCDLSDSCSCSSYTTPDLRLWIPHSVILTDQWVRTLCTVGTACLCSTVLGHSAGKTQRLRMRRQLRPRTIQRLHLSHIGQSMQGLGRLSTITCTCSLWGLSA